MGFAMNIYLIGNTADAKPSPFSSWPYPLFCRLNLRLGVFVPFQEFFLITNDFEDLIPQMKKQKIKCSPVQQQPWGLLTKVKLPGGGNLKVYQPLHVRPKNAKTKV
jgi:hypothetical protein